jgi:hypothetical protein
VKHRVIAFVVVFKKVQYVCAMGMTVVQAEIVGFVVETFITFINASIPVGTFGVVWREYYVFTWGTKCHVVYANVI